MATEAREFCNTSEEISHWKSLALDYKKRYEQMKGEFEEFQSSSKELEMELEFQMKFLEKQNSELVKQLDKLRDDHAEISEKFSRHRQQTSKTINDLEMKLLTAEETINSQKVRIVKLEIENDKLENSSRAITASLEYIQQKLDEQTEMVAYLTFEKEDLAVEVERYKEDIRDLQNDVSVRDKTVVSDGVSMATPEVPLTPCSPSQISIESRPSFDIQNTPLRAIKSSDKTPSSPQPCITAMGIVNDLMKRFAIIESKLAAIRNCNKTFSVIRQKTDHPALGENCNGNGSRRQSQVLNRRWSNLFRFSLFSETVEPEKPTTTMSEAAQP